MADISLRITKKSLKAKRKAAIKTIKAQTKEKIRAIKMEYAVNSERKKIKAAERAQKKELRIQKANARLAYNERQPRQYTLGEELFNSISHGIGAGLSVAAIVLLVIRAVFHTPAGSSTALYVTSFSIFGASLFILYLMSTLYHAITVPGARKVFSVLDHDAIYILIAGTYTPFVLTKIPSSAGIAICASVWGICAALIALYSVFKSRLRSFSVFTYLVLGWLIISVFTFYPLGTVLSNTCRAMLFAGGAAYTVGGVFFLMRKYKWTHSIFHLFVLGGSVLHFFAVYFSL